MKKLTTFLCFLTCSFQSYGSVKLSDLKVFTCTEINLDGSTGYSYDVASWSKSDALQSVASHYRIRVLTADQMKIAADYADGKTVIKRQMFGVRGGCGVQSDFEYVKECLISDLICR